MNMSMKSNFLITTGLLSLATAFFNLSGCNGANSADSPSEPTNLTEPTADIRLVSSSGDINADGYYSQNTTLTVEGEAVGSLGSTVSCVINQDFKESETAEFTTIDNIASCANYDFLMASPGIYRYKLTVTDGNALIAEDQMFAIAVEDNTAIYLDSDPVALVEIMAASTDPDNNGYYFDDTTLTVNASASGSSGSDVICSVEFSINSGTASDFTVLQTVSGCGVKDFNLYNGTGTYRVRLTATDSNAEVAEDQKYVIAIPTELANSVYLNAEFEFTVSTDPASLFDVFLDATSSNEGEGGDITNVRWDVFLKEDDEITETPVEIVDNNSLTTTVTVDRDGIYVAKLTLTDESEQTAITEKMFIVGGTGDELIADFSVTIPDVAPVNIEVDASASSIVAGIDHYEWEVRSFLDEGVLIYKLSTESATTVLPIAIAGNYFIRLTVIDVDGNEHEITRVVTVPAT